MANATAPDDFPLINTPQPPRPFDAAQGKPFDAVQGKPFDGTQGKPFDIAQAKSALVPAERSWDMFVPEVKPAATPPRVRESAPEPAAHAPSPATPAATRKVTPPPVASPSVANTLSKRRATFKTPPVSPWIAATLGVIALMEGVAIAALLMRQPANATPAAAATATVAASPIPDGAAGSTPPPAAPAVATAVPEQRPVVLAAAVDPIKAAASKQQSGGVQLVAPFELKVLQGDKVLGSTADGPIIAAAGTYQLDLINTAYGFRTRRAVTFRAQQITKVDVTIPPGRLSVNAQPWAEVSIDNQPKGDTPLANLSVAVGEHEIVYRHPELGERRQTVVVRADQPARASVSFER